jgi:uncharacterized protein (TIGR02145 family)
MENSEKKSLISTGSSNLAKTEKLLSITQKILSEIKPQYESVKIGNQEWMTRNLDVDRFLNGDLIPHIESDKEWEKAGENGEPAWCYYDNDPEYREKYGKLYNWYAVNDPRGLAPEGYHVPTDEEWTILEEFLGGKDIAGHKMKSVDEWGEYYDRSDFHKENLSDIIDFEDYIGVERTGNGDNSSGFNAFPYGGRGGDGEFHYGRYMYISIRHPYYLAGTSFFWSITENSFNKVWLRELFINSNKLIRLDYEKFWGASVRCIRD